MTFRQKTRMSEEDAKVARIEIYDFIASKCFVSQGTVKICQVLQAGKIL
jgi:hypothetical protein